MPGSVKTTPLLAGFILPEILHGGCGGCETPRRRDQSMALKLKAAPCLIPEGQREVTVLVRE